MPKTKIVCTIGPASCSADMLERLIRAGMNVARLNFSHGNHDSHGRVISRIREISVKLGRPVAILQDLAGPKVRIGRIASEPINLRSGETFILTGRDVSGDENEVSVNYPYLSSDVKEGDPILLSDGEIELKVLESRNDDIRCRILTGGILTSHKGINLPTRSLNIPALTEKDKLDLEFGIQNQVDYMALSFVRSRDDVIEAKKFIEKQQSDIPLIAKIEKHEALENIDEIISGVDGIMVARGDLGVEIPLEKIPRIQKMLIQKSNIAGKPVITATQMLRSMVGSPRPTRAEVTDVANAVFDGSDAVMLSEETAVGKYPVEALSVMAKTAEDAESVDRPHLLDFDGRKRGDLTIPEAVSHAACDLADNIDAACIITFTKSGSTAASVSRYRPLQPILAPTPEESTYRRLSLQWGVIPMKTENIKDTDQMISSVFKVVRESGLVRSGQKVVITAGIPVYIPGTTNLVKAEILP